MNAPLYTFVYEGLDIDTFILRLRSNGVKAIVDVRELPLSRKKGFSKTALAECLKREGIAYLHMPALGCPKPIRNRYREDGNWQTYTRDFLAYLETQESTVRQLAGFAQASTACLICFEADFSLCHRSYVAREVAHVAGLQVQHITARTVVSDRTVRLAA